MVAVKIGHSTPLFSSVAKYIQQAVSPPTGLFYNPCALFLHGGNHVLVFTCLPELQLLCWGAVLSRAWDETRLTPNWVTFSVRIACRTLLSKSWSSLPTV